MRSSLVSAHVRCRPLCLRSSPAGLPVFFFFLSELFACLPPSRSSSAVSQAARAPLSPHLSPAPDYHPLRSPSHVQILSGPPASGILYTFSVYKPHHPLRLVSLSSDEGCLTHPGKVALLSSTPSVCAQLPAVASLQTLSQSFCCSFVHYFSTFPGISVSAVLGGTCSCAPG